MSACAKEPDRRVDSSIAGYAKWPRGIALSAGLVALALLVAFPLVFTLPYPRDVMIRIFLYAMLATAWNMLAGYCGQISLGHAIFFGTGAYTSTVLVRTLGLTPWAGMLAGAALAVALSQVIGYPVFRLRGHYFAIATIAVGEIVQTLMINWDWVGGARGLFIPIDRTGSLLTFQFRDKQVYYYIALGLLLLALWVTRRIEARVPAITSAPSARTGAAASLASSARYKRAMDCPQD
jgi:branched-chain amino acid transport system permease protein